MNEYETTFLLRVQPLLRQLYDDKTVEIAIDNIFNLLQNNFCSSLEENIYKWSEDNVILITYGDSIKGNADEKPLVTLQHFLTKHLQDTITGVHLLPFFPYSSDDGFAVMDYLAVNPDLGDWEDIKKISNQFNLMVDLVINHISSKSEWFRQFKQGIKPRVDYFIEVDPSTDLSAVVRPRSSPLLAKVDTVNGEKHVWATFSHDQIDLDFTNPDVLLEFIKIIFFYVQMGAKYIRLDAIGYLWKKIGTSSIHLRETHTMIKLLREILQMVDSSVALITETNVPNRENLSYFGNRNEAHLIYNFSLSPLIINALIRGESNHLMTWMMSMPPAPLGCAYLNFTASHDGIGLRPAEGILTPEESATLVETMKQFGAEISMRTGNDGQEHLYEINISLFDAFKGTIKGEDEWQIERFLCSQIIAMSLEGIPAFYIHSLLATPNDVEHVRQTGRKRSINRHQWNEVALAQQLNNPNSNQSLVLKELSRLIRIRRRQKAFHPNATQYTLHLGNSLFSFWRQSMSRDQSIFSIHNVTDRPQVVCLSELNIYETDNWCDLMGSGQLEDIHGKLTLKPYQSVWLTNKSCAILDKYTK
ncbi:MAG: sugar phosphorylase [Prochloron sp. SP5CPC1]|nr:sugar phosphorylase [Candidatus Paraprochloron terpiosi SP5CPC1]